MIAFGKLCLIKTSCKIVAIIVLLYFASFPPFKIQTFPLFIHKLAVSLVTFGRDSYMIPITPIGTETFWIFKDVGVFQPC